MSIPCPCCKITELSHINFIIYSVVEKITSPFEDDSSLIVNYFSSEDKQMEFFKKRIDDYKFEDLFEEELTQFIYAKGLTFEHNRTDPCSIISIDCKWGFLDEIEYINE